jgi:hypothetical protein
MSDYCYSDRLFPWILDPFPQPMAFGFCLLQHNLLAVLSPDKSGFRDEVSFRHCCAFPEGSGISFGCPLLRTSILRTNLIARDPRHELMPSQFPRPDPIHLLDQRLVYVLTSHQSLFAFHTFMWRLVAQELYFLAFRINLTA